MVRVAPFATGRHPEPFTTARVLLCPSRRYNCLCNRTKSLQRGSRPFRASCRLVRRSKIRRRIVAIGVAPRRQQNGFALDSASFLREQKLQPAANNKLSYLSAD
jgi:hypothetical protein